ncbi:MAG: carboxymuconolactone decarboxylase family protein [Thiohalocapsa sp.]
MIEFPCHSPETAPDGALPVFEASRKTFGMVPNLFRTMAEAPALLEGYWELNRIFSGSSLSPVEQQVVLIAASVTSGCTYCVGVQSALADMGGIPTEVTDALRSGQPAPDARLEALRRFTQTLVEAQGWVPDQEVQAFIDSGYDRSQVLEVVLGVGLKTLSNYTNHLAATKLDIAFEGRA